MTVSVLILELVLSKFDAYVSSQFSGSFEPIETNLSHLGYTVRLRPM